MKQIIQNIKTELSELKSEIKGSLRWFIFNEDESTDAAKAAAKN